MDRTDGLKIQVRKGWVLMRPSNTEPILRVVTEAGTAQAAEALNNEFRTRVQDIIDSARMDCSRRLIFPDTFRFSVPRVLRIMIAERS